MGAHLHMCSTHRQAPIGTTHRATLFAAAVETDSYDIGEARITKSTQTNSRRRVVQRPIVDVGGHVHTLSVNIHTKPSVSINLHLRHGVVVANLYIFAHSDDTGRAIAWEAP